MDSARLSELAKAHNATVVEMLSLAIDAIERQDFLRGLAEDWRELREDPELWTEYKVERREWDALA